MMKSILSLSFALLSFTQQAFSAPTSLSTSLESFDLPNGQSIERRAVLAKVVKKCTKAKTVALTFDDGPYQFTPDIIATLKKYDAKATFFVNGNNWGCIYGDKGKHVKDLFKAGHQIASHTWSHADLSKLSWDQLYDEMDLVNKATRRLLGVTPAFVRPPYGSQTNLVRQAAQLHGQTVALWDFDSGDSTGLTVEASKQLYTDLANKKPNNVLALNHDTSEVTAKQILPHALKVLKAKGYKFVTVAECLDMAPYQNVGTPVDGDWTCEPQLKVQ